MGFELFRRRIVAPAVTTHVGSVHRQQWVHPAAPGNTGVHAAITLPEDDPLVVTTGITSPAMPRTLRIKGNAAGITGDVVITGRDQFGVSTTDTIATSGSSAVDGVVAFSSVSSIEVPVLDSPGDTISVGPGPALGLNRRISSPAGIVGGAVNGAREADLPVLNAQYHTILFDTALDSEKTYLSYYLHEDVSH